MDSDRMERSARTRRRMGHGNSGGATRPFDRGQRFVKWAQKLNGASPRRAGPHQDGNPEGSGWRSTSHDIDDVAHHGRRSLGSVADHGSGGRHPRTAAIVLSRETRSADQFWARTSSISRLEAVAHMHPNDQCDEGFNASHVPWSLD